MARGTRPSTRGSERRTRRASSPTARAEILSVGGGEVGRLVLEPGWRWSNDLKPIAGTEYAKAG